ncbi:hypothetical protein CFP65_6695 [Kitasatospora sp. MMS16-BH015]|uniref:serine hydrolase domain-containing protein n=1 Tax=Kitasatospora sp. MMS16-BH015 TaxID=2018025 RepID=UPI000CA1189E|nr:serine hydrolase domain-containing protein [Kitasatospora sp. MMS16-BH015]AUG81339.1 hypothetical protein CFP65_6695 [Kitasatospora sp. MMS16-BH015]
MKTTAVTAVLTAALLSVTPVAFGADRESGGHRELQAALDRAVTEAHLPGVLVEVRDGGASWFGQAGTAELGTGRGFEPQDRFRIGSTTKTFVATVLLQLEAEHRLSLDDSVERWLPGLVDGNGYEGSKITIRQLLNHTSGIANFATAVQDEFSGEPFLRHRFDRFTPRQLVELGLSTEPQFAPGAGWQYSDTNYVLAGLVVEQATGRSLGQEITDRLVRPLHLKSTYEPAPEDTGIRGPHGRFYSKLGPTYAPASPVYDVTELNPSWGWGSGDLVSTAGDLATFFQQLLKGRVLPPAQLAEMLDTQDPGRNWIPGTRYGLGLASATLSCGQVWGMGGAIDGSWSYTFGTRDGRHLLSTEVNGDWADDAPSKLGPISVFQQELEAEFCGGGAAAR